MKNSKGISLIALIITIIVIIILAAIVIGGVFNTPNDAKFANFCQEYDRIQTAIQLRYYELYQKYAISPSTEIPTHHAIYFEVATGPNAASTTTLTASERAKYDKDGWVKITTLGGSLCDEPNGLSNDWYLRTNDGKLAYQGFEKGEADMYYTPSTHADASAVTGKPRILLKLTGSDPNKVLELDTNATGYSFTPANAFDLAPTPAPTSAPTATPTAAPSPSVTP